MVTKQAYAFAAAKVINLIVTVFFVCKFPILLIVNIIVRLLLIVWVSTSDINPATGRY